MAEKKYQFLDTTQLKLTALFTMVLDHVGDNFFPDQLWMRAAGRIAMPVFAFSTAQGYRHTRNKIRYLVRMTVFALVSEMPFDLVTAGRISDFSHQNIMFTFAWAIAGLMLYEKIIRDGSSKGRNAAGAAVLLLFCLLSVFLRLDYSLLASGLVFIFYVSGSKSLFRGNILGMLYHVICRNMGIHWFGLLGFVPLFLYNGKRGRGLKWLFYVFYPGHLLLIYLIRSLALH